MRGYSDGLYAVFIVGVVSAMLLAICPTGSTKSFLKLASSCIYLLCLLSIFGNEKFRSYEELASGLQREADEAVVSGEQMRREQISDSIKVAIDEYIESKAMEGGYAIRVNSVLSEADPPMPSWIYLSGEIPEAGKKTLEQMIEQELSVTKEHLIWSGQQYGKNG